AGGAVQYSVGRSRFNVAYHSLTSCLSSPVPPHHIQELFTKTLELGIADAVNSSHLCKGCRLAACDVEQATVRQDHVSRNCLSLGERRAADAQRLEQSVVRAISPAKCHCRRGFSLRFLATTWGRDGVLAQLHLRLGLEHGPAGRWNSPAAIAGDF